MVRVIGLSFSYHLRSFFFLCYFFLFIQHIFRHSFFSFISFFFSHLILSFFKNLFPLFRSVFQSVFLFFSFFSSTYSLILCPFSLFFFHYLILSWFLSSVVYFLFIHLFFPFILPSFLLF